MDSLDRFRGLLGIVVFLLICWALSTNRRRVQWRAVVWGLGLQFLFAFIVLRTALGRAFFDWMNDVFLALINFTSAGAGFVFGNLIWNNLPVGTGPAGQNGSFTPGESVANAGAFFAFQVLPTIIFFSSLMAILYHIGVMNHIVKGLAWVMFRTMRTSGAESLAAAANIFVGQTEAPLVVRPFIAKMTRSELMAIMVGGLANTAGGVLIAYIGFLRPVVGDSIAGHLLAVSIMSAPASLLVAKLMVPEVGEPVTMGTLKTDIEKPDVNLFDAAARGASEGLHLALNVGAMLIAFIALLALVNGLLGWAGGRLNPEGFGPEGARLSLNLIFSYLFWPVAWLMGVDVKDCREMGNLLGLKTFANEFVAYMRLGDPAVSGEMSQRSVIIASYALCGFANFSSIGILLGGLSPLAPERRHDLARLGLRALIGGSIATFLCACIAGVLLTESDLFPARNPVAIEQPANPPDEPATAPAALGEAEMVEPEQGSPSGRETSELVTSTPTSE